jgi:Caspase domain
MAGRRRALIVANDRYEHEGLKHLLAPGADAEALAGVLGDPGIGDFEVRVVRNEPAHVIQGHIEDLFSEARPEDVLLLHFSCHGLKSESGELFFAAGNTRPHRLGSTATSADFVQRCMRTSRSRSVVLLLDCCYGGAFSKGVTVRAAGDMNVLGSFPGGRLGGGRGRAVITASSAMEYAFEGDQLADDHSRQPSVFTSALVEGLATGDADRDQDGWVSLNELYDYVFDRVREQNPHQTPSRDVEMQGELYVARRSRPVTTAAPLPPELQAVIDHPIAGVRAGAVQELARLNRGRHAGLALAATSALERLARDDSRTVAAAAAAALAGTDEGRADEGRADEGRADEGRADEGAARDEAADAPVRPAGPARDGARRGIGSRRWIIAGGAALVLAGAATTTALLLARSGDGGRPRQSVTGRQFTETSPWRLVIQDATQGNDPGCDVTVTGAGKPVPVASPTEVYSPLAVQVRESGTFTWTTNSAGCIVLHRPGAGAAQLPFVTTTRGDTDAFAVQGPVTVQVLTDNGNGTCGFVLHDATDGRPVAIASAAPSAAAATLDPAGSTSVYLANPYCDVRVAAK